jgi:small subunit ribosomal protein S14
MSKISTIQNNEKRKRLVLQYAIRRNALKKIIYDKQKPLEERYYAQLELSKLPRNSSKVRVRNICRLTGRSRGFYRDLEMSRICLRELAGFGLLPGIKKASW